jgi:hypothetical protein
MSTLAGMGKDELARAVAADIPPGSFVNLGIGLPTRISNHLPPGSGIMLHTENGMLGMGPEAQDDQVDPDLVNAGKIPVTELPGASYFHHADSFAMMRGGHIDICVLGAYQVSAHTVPPTGAKGLNLALADVRVLAEVLERAVRRKDADALDEYGPRALARVWKAQHFSYWMTTMLHALPGATDFDLRRQLGELESVASSVAGSTYLAEAYTGWPSR